MADLNSTIVRGSLRVTDEIICPSMIKSVTIGLTQSLNSYNGTSQSITHTANQEVVFDGFSNETQDVINYTKDISIKRTSDTNTNVYIQLYSDRGGVIDDRTVIYYHIVTYNS